MIKRNIFIIIVFFILAGLIFPQSITVTEPDPGETWYKGSTYDIKWTSSGCTDNSIKINIFKNSVSVANFIEQLTSSDTGSKSWTIPANYVSGNYKIRIKTSDDLCIGDSGVFKISIKTISTTLQQIAPKPPSSYPTTSKSNILANTAIPYFKSVKIDSKPILFFNKVHPKTAGGLLFVHTITAVIGNNSFAYDLKNIRLRLFVKKTIQSPYKIQGYSQTNIIPSILRGRTIESKFTYITKDHGVFKSNLSLLNNKYYLYSKKSYNHSVDGIAELYPKVRTKLKHKIGEKVGMIINVHNVGSIASPYFKIGLWDGMKKILTKNCPGIKPKGYRQIPVVFKWEKAIAAIWIVVDCGNQVNEAGKENNRIRIVMTEYTDWSSPNPEHMFEGNKEDYYNYPSSTFNCK